MYHINVRSVVAVIGLNIMTIFTMQASVVFSHTLKGEITAEGNRLTWSTSDESDCAFFIIEKSADGIHFATVATLPATHTDEKERHYFYLDKESKDLRVFYRLVELADSGEGHFSHAVIINRKGENAKFELQAVASIATHAEFNATVNCKVAGTFNYRIMTNMGEVLDMGSVAVEIGTNELTINTDKLPVATYQLALRLENDTELFKLKKTDSPELPKTNFARKN